MSPTSSYPIVWINSSDSKNRVVRRYVDSIGTIKRPKVAISQLRTEIT